MGTFHCPIGAISYRSYGCIECKLCISKTKEEMQRATEIIREHIRSNAALRHQKNDIRKIAICGKGGAGKSTLTAMMAFSLKKYGYSPIIIDTDDSNAGLHRKLGIMTPPKPLVSCLERFSIGEEAPDTEWLVRDPLKPEDIPEPFISCSGGLRFMMSGKIENPLQGCSCSISDITKQIVQNLELGEKEILLVDHDAGIESFGRGAEQGVNTVLIVIEPSFESVSLAETIQYMSEGLGIRRIRAIVNKVLDEEQTEIIFDMLSEKELRFLGALESDRALMRSNLMGTSVCNAPLQAKVDHLVSLMLDEAEMSYTIT